ncbi:hypothetical protein [Mesorhizobium sp. M0058]|uniref:hypothetical protein n=1 Tax=Mesorhizobium sp. M0058 TaxID=2956865 RepID=UPI0033380623
MANFKFHMGVTLRCYGNVEIEADTIENAIAELTADNIGESISITETTTDSGQDLAIIGVTDADTGEDLGDWDCAPSEYDPKPLPPVIVNSCYALSIDGDHATTLQLFATKAEREDAMWDHAFSHTGTESATIDEFKAEYDNDADEAMHATGDGWLTDEMVAADAPIHRSDTVDALTQAESFISGFEDDELQEGIGDILAGLRAAIQREQARPDIMQVLYIVREDLLAAASDVLDNANRKDGEYPRLMAAKEHVERVMGKAEGQAND